MGAIAAWTILKMSPHAHCGTESETVMPLTAEEVEQLRRIHELSLFGELPSQMQALLDELRARDSDAVHVAPVLDIQIMPRKQFRDEDFDDDDYDDYEQIAVAQV